MVQSYEYFGHDAVVRVRPEIDALPELVVRITGGHPLVAGHPGRSLQVRRRRRWRLARTKCPESRLRNYGGVVRPH